MTSRTILIVDDESDIREIAQATLELTAGWRVVAAESGEAGLALAASQQPDAILLDVMMPGLDGPETLRRLRSSSATAGIPVIFMTAKVQATDRQRWADLEVQGVIPKPFDPMALGSDIADALRWSGV